MDRKSQTPVSNYTTTTTVIKFKILNRTERLPLHTHPHPK